MSGPRLFTDTLNALRFGTLNEELGKELNKLVQACADTGKAGELTLKLKLKPGTSGQIEVFDDIAVRAPKEEKGSSIMFATPEGNLQREDPRQQAQAEGLRVIDKAAGELRKVG